jgi:transcriptional regulator with XRE-family HTH domain
MTVNTLQDAAAASALPGLLRSYRERYGLTQAALSEIMGVSRSHVANAEAGRNDLTASALLRLFHFYLKDVQPDPLPLVAMEVTRMLGDGGPLHRAAVDADLEGHPVVRLPLGVHAVDVTPRYVLDVVLPNLRDQWHRHQPVYRGRGDVCCAWCSDGGRAVAWPCHDAAALMRLLGVTLEEVA